MQSQWGCTTSCNTSTPQGPMPGCCLWTSARRSTPSSQKSSSPKLTQLTVPTSTCQWITHFLIDRKQQVRLGQPTSSTRSVSTGAPQGCVLSPLPSPLYTNDCTSRDPSVKLKLADDTSVIARIRDNDESAYRREVEQLVLWCGRNNLELNTLKTVEMTVDFRRSPPA